MSINLNRIRTKDEFITTQNSMHLKNYNFKPNEGIVEIDDKYDVVQYIINVTRGVVIYNPTTFRLSGDDQGTQVALNLDTSSMSAIDDLMIVAEVSDITRETSYKKLQDLESELKNINELLNETIN